MTNTERILANNVALRECIEMAEKLPAIPITFDDIATAGITGDTETDVPIDMIEE